MAGTLREAGLLLHDVPPGLPRALLAMFIVPTLWHEQYLDCLRELTR